MPRYIFVDKFFFYVDVPIIPLLDPQILLTCTSSQRILCFYNFHLLPVVLQVQIFSPDIYLAIQTSIYTYT